MAIEDDISRQPTDTTASADSRELAEVLAFADPLLALAARLDQELAGRESALTAVLHRSHLTVAYRQVLILQWRSEGRDLICTPIGWRQDVHITSDHGEAHRMTARLVFEFAKRIHDAVIVRGPRPETRT